MLFWVSILAFLVVCIPLALQSLSQADKAHAAWFNNNWIYRKSIPITSHSSAESNVYISVTLDSSDTTRFQSDCGDLRFTKQDGASLPYYVVSGCGTSSTVIHIELQSFPAGAQTLYYYYGNPSAANGFSKSDFATAATSYSVGTLGSETQAPGPLAYWKFDEGTGTTTHDSTQQHNDSTLSGTTKPTWQEKSQCISGKCLYFDGSSSSVLPSSSPYLTKWTLQSWINPINSPTSGNDIGIIGRYQGSPYQHNFWLDLTYTASASRALTCGFYNGSTWVYATSTINIPLSQWSYVACTFDGTVMKLFLNGQEMSLQANTVSGTPSNYGTLSIGANYAQSTGYFKGFIDEPKIYNYAQSANQIKADYNGALSAGNSAVLGAAANQTLNNGLVGYWKMDESGWNGTSGEVKDASGNGNNGTAAGSPSKATIGSGKFGNASSLDGTDDYVSLPRTVQDDFTISAWYKTSTTGTGTTNWYNGKQIVSAEACGSVNDFGTAIDSSGKAMFGIGNPDTTIIGTTNTADGTWHFMTATRTKSTGAIKLYIDGQLQQSGTAPNTGSLTAPSNIDIGSDPCPGSGNYFNGSIDEVRTYNRVLSPSEISELYNYAPGPVAHYAFDEGQGGAVNDISGNGYTGAWNGSGSHWTQGKYGKAGNFDGTDDYVGTSPFPNNTSPLTVSAWVNPSSLSQSSYNTGVGGTIIDENESGGSAGWIFGIKNNNKLWFWPSGSNDKFSTATIPINTWTFVEATYDGTSIRFFINGILDSTQTMSAPQGSATFFKIGAKSWITGYWKGKLDDVQIYNYARSSGQVTQDMNASHPLGGSPMGSQVGYWKFDEGYGTTAHNSGNAGSALNTTITSAIWTNSGKFNKALSFNGTSSYVQMPYNSAIDISTLTLSAWIKPTSLCNCYIITRGDNVHTADADKQYELSLRSDGTLRFRAAGTSVAQGGSVTAGQWSYVAVTYDPTDPTNARIYLNGVQVAGGNGTVSTISNAGLVIGSNLNLNSTFNGLIDEVKLYSAALTPQEIQIDYNHGQALSMGSTGTDSSGNPSSSADRAYCPPGDTTATCGPIGEWNFEEGQGTTVNDTSGNGNTVTWNGTGSHWTQGKVGKAGNFDGSNDFVHDTSAFSTSLGSFSIGMWVKTKATSEQYLYSLNRNGSNITNEGIFEMNADGTLTYWDYNGSSFGFSQGQTSTKSINDGNWHYVFFTKNGTAGAYYIDGALDAQPTAGTTVTVGTADLTFGGNYRSSNLYWKGQIDQIQIFNYALSPTQVAWDYDRGAPIAQYNFDECQGMTIHDASGNGNDGTITIGASGTQTTPGTCTDGSSASAWNNGATGKYNSSLSFDGTDDYVSMGDPSSGDLDFGTGDFSVSYWAKYISVGTGGTRQVSKRPNSTGAGWSVGVGTSGLLNFRLDDGTNSTETNFGTGTSVIDSTWHLFTFTFSRSGNLSGYIDGKLNATTAISTINGSVSNTSPLDINNFNNTANAKANVLMDNVQIYNYVLTPQQIEQIYNQNSAIRFGPLTGTP